MPWRLPSYGICARSMAGNVQASFHSIEFQGHEGPDSRCQSAWSEAAGLYVEVKTIRYTIDYKCY